MVSHPASTLKSPTGNTLLGPRWERRALWSAGDCCANSGFIRGRSPTICAQACRISAVVRCLFSLPVECGNSKAASVALVTNPPIRLCCDSSSRAAAAALEAALREGAKCTRKSTRLPCVVEHSVLPEFRIRWQPVTACRISDIASLF